MLYLWLVPWLWADIWFCVLTFMNWLLWSPLVSRVAICLFLCCPLVERFCYKEFAMHDKSTLFSFLKLGRRHWNIIKHPWIGMPLLFYFILFYRENYPNPLLLNQGHHNEAPQTMKLNFTLSNLHHVIFLNHSYPVTRLGFPFKPGNQLTQ
jgi:hypothetical protein